MEESKPPTAPPAPSALQFNWIDSMYLVRAIQRCRSTVRELETPFAFQMCLVDSNMASDASIPPINTFFLYDPNKERSEKEEAEVDGAKKDSLILFHTHFESVEVYRDMYVGTFDMFYTDIIEPLFQSLFARGVIQGEYPDLNNYRASLIAAVEEHRKTGQPINYQVLQGHSGEPRRIMFLTEDEIIIFPLKPTSVQPYRCVFIDADNPIDYASLTECQRFSLPSRLLV